MKFHKLIRITNLVKRKPMAAQIPQSPPQGANSVPEVNINSPLKVETVDENTEEVPSEQANKKLFILGSIVTGIIIILSGLFVFYLIKNPIKEQKKASTVEMVVSEEKLTEVTQTVFKRSDWELEVLNGSGLPGEAKKVGDKLVNLGYQVIKTGNANKSNYLKSELYVSSNLLNTSQDLLNDLKDQLSISTISGELKDSTASARIILGKE